MKNRTINLNTFPQIPEKSYSYTWFKDPNILSSITGVILLANSLNHLNRIFFTVNLYGYIYSYYRCQRPGSTCTWNNVKSKDKDSSGCAYWGVSTYSCSSLPTSCRLPLKKRTVHERIFMGGLILVLGKSSHFVSFQTLFIHKDREQIKLWQVPFGWSSLQFCEGFPPLLKCCWISLYSHFPTCFKQKAAPYPVQLLWLT